MDELKKIRRALFSVGLTGHRPDKLNPLVAKALPDALLDLLSFINKQLSDLNCSSASSGAAYYNPDICLRSGLAAGADLAAIEAANALQWKLHLLLPEKREYFRSRLSASDCKKFDSAIRKADSLAEITIFGDEALTAEPHAALGQMLLENSNLLIAVWDGGPGRGKGGTADIVSLAIERKIPVVWLNSNELTTIQLLGYDASINRSEREIPWNEALIHYLETYVQSQTN